MSDQAANQALAAKAKKLQMEMSPDQVDLAGVVPGRGDVANVAPRTPGVMDEQFPTDALTAHDERDDEMNARLQLQVQGKPGYTQFGKLDARDEDFKWLQKKQAAVETANFQAWFAANFDHMSPAQKKWAKERYPAFYAQRKKLLKKQSKNLYDLARIKIDGIESKEDLMKTYLAETGRLDLGPLQNLLHPEQAARQREQNAAFQRGLMNPFSVFGKQALPATVEQREVEQQLYANRAYNEDISAKLGPRTGFPPFGTDATNQSDRAWWNQLQPPTSGLF